MDKLNVKNGVVQDYTIVLCTRNYKRLGQIAKIQSVNTNNNLNSADEISFSISKYDLTETYAYMKINPENHKKIVMDLWNKIVDFRLVWIKELDKYYSIKVTIEDSANTTKRIVGTSLCEEELSQTYIYNMEINTDNDVARDDYDENFPTVFYRNPDAVAEYNDIWEKHSRTYTIYSTDSNGNDLVDPVTQEKIIDEEATYKKRYNILKSSSLMHRVMEKVPHYSIGHIDESLWNLQRIFSVNGTSIHEFFTGECSEQINCLFKFDSATRTVSVYDLYTVCQNTVCNYRGDDFYNKEQGRNVCPKCGGTHLKYFGKDTTILVDKENLTDSIQLEANADNIKNCFKLSAGDDLMTAAVRLMNPNGTDYIYYISEFQRQDMPVELVAKLDAYDALYNEHITNYEKLVSEVWELESKKTELEHTMMPTIEDSEVTAKTEINKILVAYEDGTFSPIGVASISSASSTTVDSAVKNYLKVFVKSGYVKIQLSNTTYEKCYEKDKDGKDFVSSGIWSGKITLTNYSDEKDVAECVLINVEITGNYKDFVEQRILKTMAEGYTEEGSVFDVLAIEDLDKFKEALSLYCKERLESFRSAIDSALNILIELGEGEIGSELYDEMYTPYRQKLVACEEAIAHIDNEISKIDSQIDVLYNGTDESEGIYTIQEKLNFQNFLGELYPIFCCYRREDTYENSNFISDGLTDSELFERASQFITLAKQELHKVGEPQYTLSSTLYNLLAIKEFKPILKYFDLGNWIRVRVDGALYKMRLISYSVNFDSLQNINVEFSNVTKQVGIDTDASAIIQAASSAATKIDYVSKQAEKGSTAKDNIQNMLDTGIYTGLIQIKSNNTEDVIWDKNGILCRSYDDISGTYSKEQLKITHNIIAFTNNAWESVRQVIGKHSYLTYNKETNTWDAKEGYGVTTDFVTSNGQIYGATMVGGIIYSENFKMLNPTGNYETDRYDCQGSFIDLSDGHFSFGGALTWDGAELKIKDIIITSDQIESLDVNKIEGDIVVEAKNIHGYIQSNQIQDLDVDKLNGDISVKAENINGLIESNQIENLAASKLTGTVASSKIANTLSGKTLTNGSFTGSVTATSITTSHDGASYTGITQDVTYGDKILKIVNGVVVGIEAAT